MKIMINDEILHELNDIQKKVLLDGIREDVLEEHVKHLVCYLIKKKYDEVYKKMFDTWLPKLIANGIKSIPTDQEEFAQLVFSQPDYRNRTQRDEQEKEMLKEARQL